MARPTKLNPITHAAIVSAIGDGATYRDAAGAAGVDYVTFLAWMTKGKDANSGMFHEFYYAVRQAEHQARLDFTQSIKKASKDDWRAALEYLKRRDRENWGDDTRSTKDVESPTSAEAIVLPALPADLIAPDFLQAYRDIRKHSHTEYLFFGGRGSTKSSFVSLAIVWLLVNNPTVHVLAARQVADTLRDSVYSRLDWAIRQLGLLDKFKFRTSPLEIEYIPTHQKIYFRGADDPAKIKSIAPAFGYIGVLWFEELDSFRGAETVRSIEQSALRGGETAFIFKSFNPPRSAGNWANKYRLIPKATQYQHHSNYLDVPPEWLGRTFLDEAAHLKSVNPAAYEHEYMGIANGNGGQVFENLILRKITDEEIKEFDRPLHGLDWGFFPDPLHYVRCHYDAARLTLYVHTEYRTWKTPNREAYDALVALGLTKNDLIIADSAEPKSVADFRDYGANIRGAEKGPDSVRYSIKWLQSLAAIVIDPERAPYSAQEFMGYELEVTRDGELISAYPDRDNHAIDAVRYATNLIWRRRGE